MSVKAVVVGDDPSVSKLMSVLSGFVCLQSSLVKSSFLSSKTKNFNYQLSQKTSE